LEKLKNGNKLSNRKKNLSLWELGIYTEKIIFRTDEINRKKL